jgi:SlyX protein
MTDDRGTSDHLTAIESALMHLQHEVQQLNEALIGYRRDFDALRNDIGTIRGRVEQLETGPEVRDPKLEKPPHY